MKTDYRTIEEMEKHIVRCKNCGVVIDEMIIGRKGFPVERRVMPNQPYKDVMQDYILCPRCGKEITLGESRLDLADSMALSLANLQRSRRGKND